VLGTEYISAMAVANSVACLTLIVVLTVAFRGRRLRYQLRALRFMSGYLIMTLLLDLYLVGVSRSSHAVLALLLSMVGVPLLWALVYRLWAKGE